MTSIQGAGCGGPRNGLTPAYGGYLQGTNVFSRTNRFAGVRSELIIGFFASADVDAVRAAGESRGVSHVGTLPMVRSDDIAIVSDRLSDEYRHGRRCRRCVGEFRIGFRENAVRGFFWPGQIR